MLENLISKYKKKDVDQVVYRLSYAGKFIIIKGKTMAGSLIIIAQRFPSFGGGSNKKMKKEHLYSHLYQHYIDNQNGRFRIKTLARVTKKHGQYELLKREQMELDKNRNNPLCLNNQVEVYLPIYEEIAEKYGWLNKMPVLSFKKWLKSKQRESYIKRYALK